MSNLTLTQYVAQRDALIASPPSSMGSVSVDGQTISWHSLAEYREHLNWLEGMISQLQRVNAGQDRLGFAVANFQSTQ